MSKDGLSQEIVHKQLEKAGLLPRPFFIHAYAHKCATFPCLLWGSAIQLTSPSVTAATPLHSLMPQNVYGAGSAGVEEE